MEHIKVIKEIKTFEELLILRDKYDKMILDDKSEIGSKEYDVCTIMCKYRNMLEDRILFLTEKGAKLDQININDL